MGWLRKGTLIDTGIFFFYPTGNGQEWVCQDIKLKLALSHNLILTLTNSMYYLTGIIQLDAWNKIYTSVGQKKPLHHHPMCTPVIPLPSIDEVTLVRHHDHFLFRHVRGKSTNQILQYFLDFLLSD